MAGNLKPLIWLGLVLIAITPAGCRTDAPQVTPTRVPTFQWPATFTPESSPMLNTTATRVIPVATAPPQTAMPILPTAIRITPTVQPVTPVTARPSSTPDPTLPPLTRVAVAESVRGTAIAQATATVMAATVQATLIPSAAGTVTAAPLDAYQLIERGWIRGEIDIDHAAVFRLYSLMGGGRTRVPPQYLSDVLINGDGLGLFMYAFKDWFELSPATQVALGGYATPRLVTQAELSATPTSTPVVRIPGGVYANTIVAQDKVAGALPMTGHWTFDLTSGAVTLNGKRVITRSISQRDRQVVFVDEYGSYACEEVGQEGIYTWVGSEKALTFTKVNDPCDSRSQLLTAHPWIKP